MNNFYNIEFNVGEKVRIDHKTATERHLKLVKGRIIFKNEFFITVKTKHYNTSINLVDFITGSAVLL